MSNKRRKTSKDKESPRPKEEIVRDIKAMQESERRRSRVSNELWPFLKGMEEQVRYIKIFLHTASVAANQAFDNGRGKVKIKDLPDLVKPFKDDEKTKKYVELFEMFKDETLNSFQAIVRDLPDNLERYLFFKGERETLNAIDIKELLG